MVGRNTMPEVVEGQETASMDSLPYFPTTVDDHTLREEGVTLHTIDADPDTDIEIYDDERDAHRRGNPPESE